MNVSKRKKKQYWGRDVELAKKNIAHLVGLTGIELEDIIYRLQDMNVDWQDEIDWKTVGEEIRDRSNPYHRVWEYLEANYGIIKPATKEEHA